MFRLEDKKHKYLLWLLRISDTFFDVLFDDQYLTRYKTPAIDANVSISQKELFNRMLPQKRVLLIVPPCYAELFWLYRFFLPVLHT